MMSSGKQSVKIYFDPDVNTCIDASENEEVIVGTRNGGHVYKLHLINVDRQKDDSLEIEIKDFRDAEALSMKREALGLPSKIPDES